MRFGVVLVLLAYFPVVAPRIAVKGLAGLNGVKDSQYQVDGFTALGNARPYFSVALGTTAQDCGFVLTNGHTCACRDQRHAR